ncbi:MAG: IclR family transcriptional regulator [Tepidisphaeraceae bacterium]
MESTVLVKAFSLIETLASVGGESTLAELAIATGQAKPTTHRVLRSLLAMGYIAQSESGEYRLTSKLRQLALGSADRDLAALAQPILERLREQTGETVNLGVLRHHSVVYLSVIESNHALRRVAAVSEGDPLFTTALGRAIAAQLPPPAIERLLRSSSLLPKRTPRTVTDPQELRAILAQAKRDGYVIERDQTDLGVTCLGAPVFRRGEVAAAVSISAPSARAEGYEPGWVKHLTAAASALSRKLDESERAIA